MRMPDTSFSVEMVSGVPVVVTPAEIDITNADRLRAALLEAAGRRPEGYVVDMSRTQFCDTAGIHALVLAHQNEPALRAVEYGWSSRARRSCGSSQ